MKQTYTFGLTPFEKEEKLVFLCEKKLRAPCKYFRILKKSLDARDKSDIRWVYTVECSRSREPDPAPARDFPRVTRPAPEVYIAGMGPAGLFCAIELIRCGIRPVLLERGKCVEERERDVERFFGTGKLDPESNVQFGEGGAGTFSDGKLNTQTNTPLNREVTETFLAFGAPAEIGYLGKPHIGSDKLKDVVKNMRAFLLGNGARIRYSSRLTDISVKGGKLDAIYVDGVREEAQTLVLAVGHSARDVYETLLLRGVNIERKEFAVGVRVEHLQENISRAQYGGAYRALPAADYKLVSHVSDRAAFTFCMCPGGVVVPSASEEGGVVTNGMSDFARDGKNADSALVVQVRKEDLGGESPLAGVEFQRKLERAAYAATRDYRAPVQLAGDFLGGRESCAFGEVLPTYARGTEFAPLEAYLPPFVTETLRLALPDMDRRLRGFAAPDALLVGVESRTSSPVRIVRGEDMQSNVAGLYPCGEGCGYSGGITSSAADGIRVARAIARKYL